MKTASMLGLILLLGASVAAWADNSCGIPTTSTSGYGQDKTSSSTCVSGSCTQYGIYPATCHSSEIATTLCNPAGSTYQGAYNCDAMGNCEVPTSGTSDGKACSTTDPCITLSQTAATSVGSATNTGTACPS